MSDSGSAKSQTLIQMKVRARAWSSTGGVPKRSEGMSVSELRKVN